MNYKILILCLSGFMSLSTMVQVESYNFRSAHRSMKSAESHKSIKSQKRMSVERKKYQENQGNNVFHHKDSSNRVGGSLVDSRGLMPHERNTVRRNLNIRENSVHGKSKPVETFRKNDGVYSAESSQSLDRNWRFQRSVDAGQIEVSQNFRPKGNNVDLLVVPYKGEFYSRGGKPFSIDPGLLGRWK